MDRCSLTTELWRGSDVAAVLCVRRPPKSHFSLKRQSQQRQTSSAPGPGTILQKKTAAADNSEAWVIRQSIRLSGSFLPVNHAIQWWACASERALAVCARQVPTYIYVYKYFIAHTSLYIYYGLFICILYVIILLLRSRSTCSRGKKITIDDGQRNTKTADSKIII